MVVSLGIKQEQKIPANSVRDCGQGPTKLISVSLTRNLHVFLPRM